jgi:hypothetical protein
MGDTTKEPAATVDRSLGPLICAVFEDPMSALIVRSSLKALSQRHDCGISSLGAEKLPETREIRTSCVKK